MDLLDLVQKAFAGNNGELKIFDVWYDDHASISASVPKRYTEIPTLPEIAGLEPTSYDEIVEYFEYLTEARITCIDNLDVVYGGHYRCDVCNESIDGNYLSDVEPFSDSSFDMCEKCSTTNQHVVEERSLKPYKTSNHVYNIYDFGSILDWVPIYKLPERETDDEPVFGNYIYVNLNPDTIKHNLFASSLADSHGRMGYIQLFNISDFQELKQNVESFYDKSQKICAESYGWESYCASVLHLLWESKNLCTNFG